MTTSIPERTLLCRATKKLLRRVVKKINEDEKNIFPMMLLIHNYIRITYNNKNHAKDLRALINGSMWNMLEKEVKNDNN